MKLYQKLTDLSTSDSARISDYISYLQALDRVREMSSGETKTAIVKAMSDSCDEIKRLLVKESEFCPQ